MLTFIVLCGGAGTRLWPESTEARPKPLLRILGNETLLQKTYRRIFELAVGLGCKRARVLTVTNRDHLDQCMEAFACLPTNTFLISTFILEPVARGTALAISLAINEVIEQDGPSSVSIIMPADHVIEPTDKLREDIEAAVRAAGEGYVVVFGLEPTSASPGFGYIEAGERLKVGYKVDSFVEKPDATSAIALLDSGRYLWNSGIYCSNSLILRNELMAYAPTLAEAGYHCWKNAKPLNHVSSKIISIPKPGFIGGENISIDVSVMEKTKKGAVVPATFKWSDIGTWAAVRDFSMADENGNTSFGESLFLDCSRTSIRSDGRLVAALGLDNIIIVATPSEVLVASADKVQDVRYISEKAKALKPDSERPWGSFEVLHVGPGLKIKYIRVNEGASLSLQYHRHRAEHWVVKSGLAEVTCGESAFLLNEGESTYIPKGVHHRLRNAGVETLHIVEVQLGTYVDEDDIVRLDDDYGRI